jgi:hypothetical protein
MKLIYLCNGKSSVFDSQVLSLLSHYKRNNLFESIYLLFGYRNQADIDWIERKNTEDISLVFYKTYPNYPLFNFRIRKNLYLACQGISKDFSWFFFHIRDEMISFHFKKMIVKLNVGGNQVLTDVRGVNIEQIKEFSRTNSFFKALKIINYKLAFNALKEDANLSVVSEALKMHLINSLNIKKSIIKVNPCLVDDNFYFNEDKRAKIRNELNLRNDEILVVFTSGGSADWQKNKEIIKIANKGLKIINLSVDEIINDNIMTMFVPYIEVPSYLSAADIAFIWRDKSLVNIVASPVKFSEYIACGLPVIHNGTVDLINQITNNPFNGICIEHLDNLDVKQLKRIITATDRIKLSNSGINVFGLSKITDCYMQIYNSYHVNEKDTNNYNNAN